MQRKTFAAPDNLTACVDAGHMAGEAVKLSWIGIGGLPSELSVLHADSSGAVMALAELSELGARSIIASAAASVDLFREVA